MKKIQLLLIVLISFFVTSCATAGYAQRSVREMDEVSYILANYYPELHAYYMEGVLDVDSLRAVRWYSRLQSQISFHKVLLQESY